MYTQTGHRACIACMSHVRVAESRVLWGRVRPVNAPERAGYKHTHKLMLDPLLGMGIVRFV